MGYIIVQPMCTPSTTYRLPASRRLFGGLPVLYRSPVRVALTTGSLLLPKRSKLNPRCGFSGSALPGSTNSTCCPVRSVVYLWISAHTPSDILTTRNERRLRSAPHNSRPSVPLYVNAASTWISDSCVHLLPTTLVPTSLRIGLSVPTMGTRRISWLLMKRPEWPGCSSLNLRTPPSILFAHS